MTQAPSRRPFGKRRLALLLVCLVVAIGLLLAALRMEQVDPRLAQIEQAVRASFPRFCVGGRMVITREPSPTTSEVYAVGCESTQARFGPAFRLDANTCQVFTMSLTLASELEPLPNGKLPVCPI